MTEQSRSTTDAIASRVSVTTIRVNRTQAVFHDYAGRQFRLVYEVRCHTCNHDRLHEINELKVLGISTQKILDGLAITGISRASLDHHFAEHLPGVRSMVVGMNAVLAAATALDETVDTLRPEEMLATIREIGTSRMMNGEIQPTISDMIAAARAEKDLQRLGDAAVSDAIYAEAITILCEAVRRELNEDAFSRFMWQIRSHPRMRVILAQLDDMRSGSIPAVSRDSMVTVPEDLLPSL